MWGGRTQEVWGGRTQEVWGGRTCNVGQEDPEMWGSRACNMGLGGPRDVGQEDPPTHHVIKVNEGVVNCHHPQPLLQAGAQHQATNAAKATLISAALIN